MRLNVRNQLGRFALCLSALLLVSCAERFVSIYKKIPTTINDETDKWDGTDSESSWGGYNQVVLKDWLEKAQIDYSQISIFVSHDHRKCVHGFSSVTIQGTYEYKGATGSFQSQKEVNHSVGSAMPNPKRNHARCNAIASEAIALGVAQSIRRQAPPPPAPVYHQDDAEIPK
jgi:hypothetical protein